MDERCQDHFCATIALISSLQESSRCFHTLRHTLPTFLVTANADPKTVQATLRHADVSTTLGICAHANSDFKMAAQRVVLDEFVAEQKTS